MSEDEKIELLKTSFPPVVWSSEPNTSRHQQLRLIPMWIGNKGYALYTNLDGLIVRRVYIDSIGKHYHVSKDNATEFVRARLKKELEGLERE